MNADDRMNKQNIREREDLALAAGNTLDSDVIFPLIGKLFNHYLAVLEFNNHILPGHKLGITRCDNDFSFFNPGRHRIGADAKSIGGWILYEDVNIFVAITGRVYQVIIMGVRPSL